MCGSDIYNVNFLAKGKVTVSLSEGRKKNLTFYSKVYFYPTILNYMFHLHRAEGPSGVSNFELSSGQHFVLECHANLSGGKRSQS